MAASDKHYRDQNVLDIVFAVSSFLMLVSVIWMFAQDFNREYKAEQRTFRDVEQAIAQRLAFEQIPNKSEFDSAEKNVEAKRRDRAAKDSDVERLKAEIEADRPKKEKSEQTYNDVKSKVDSITSFLYIELEKNGDSAQAAAYRKEIDSLKPKLDGIKAEQDAVLARMKRNQAQIDEWEKPLTDALSELKKVNDRFDAQVKAAVAKQWRFGDWVRTVPILEGFAPALKIHQFTINDIPIDYNFKHVTRFDRCMTCHQGIDRPAFTKANLKALTRATPEQRAQRDEARRLVQARHKALEGHDDAKKLPDPSDVKLTKVSADYLTDSRINEFCAHPRLDLFVDPTSKHPAERFGCTSCHAGQGSATSFTLASHAPTDTFVKKRWEKDLDWSFIHDWEFPMLPQRFIESSCLKCHHQVTDLIGSDNRNEAPKLLRGYNLIKENGCFGCHEISGRKGGKDIGPDLRLEPKPPLEDLTAGERAKLEADPDNPPGTMRKVGPSLLRIAEKTSREWTAKWLKAPRSFRPDTKMPHFYGLSNNHPSVLPPEQKGFPDAEIHCVTHYLFSASDSFLAQKDPAPPRLIDQSPPGYTGDAAKGRILFSERGCLACHSHQGTEKTQGKGGDATYSPAIHGEANFGPNLSQLKEKLGVKQGDRASAKKWLMQWMLNPQFHSPRSRMPVTHLTPHEAADLAAWLLSQPATDLGADWADLAVPAPDEETLVNLAKTYFIRLLSRSDMDSLFRDKTLPADVVKDLPEDERTLATKYSSDNLKLYLGKKAVGRLGCFACHDIPGVDHMKPIGVGLNDWGKKDGNRLAFEDVANYVRHNYHIVPKLVDKNGIPVPALKEHRQVKPAYEQFFFDMLEHHRREGFLYQKLSEPRSFDHNRLLAWDDRARMPQFRFGRSKKKDGESVEAFEARSNVEEAEAREAVMTFILGLVAEPVPSISINQPKGDRLAEVKGRQILDKYNCAGCHLIRGGVLEINTKSKDVQKKLELFHGISQGAAVTGGDHNFADHNYWTGKNPPSTDQLTLFGVNGRLIEEENDAAFQIRLTQALRFQAADKSMKDISAASILRLNPRDVLYPQLPPLKSKKELKESEQVEYYAGYRAKLAKTLADHGPYGGYFANLLVPYLVKKDKSTPPFFKLDDPDDPQSDSAPARAAVPPILLGQGERTQSEWLYNFLLNPQPVRRMTVLRMPRFNMSKEEARALVDYFAAVERIQNPRVGLTFPFETILQQEDLKEQFWRQKTVDYVARLKSTKAKDITGKELGVSLFQQRIEELQPVWRQILKDQETQLASAKAKADLQSGRVADLKAEEEKLKKQKDAEKDEAKSKKLADALKDLEEKRKTAEDILKPWQDEMDSLKEAMKGGLAELQKTWEDKDAYLTDGFRLLANKQLCMQCHQVGKFPVINQTQGPPLSLAHQRLRPGWLERWIATPQRFLTYGSAMPTNFPHSDKPGMAKFQEFFGGPAQDQVQAVRDVLMAYPRAMAMPVNHYWYMPLPAEMTGEKK